MTFELVILMTAAIVIGFAVIFKRCERLRIIAIFANALLLYWAVQMEYVPILGLMLALLVFNLLTLRRLTREPDAKQATSDLEQSVQECRGDMTV
ncbi:MAG: hypothetical protein AB8B62_17165 [Roseobacter sp.]